MFCTYLAEAQFSFFLASNHIEGFENNNHIHVEVIAQIWKNDVENVYVAELNLEVGFLLQYFARFYCPL